MASDSSEHPFVVDASPTAIGPATQTKGGSDSSGWSGSARSLQSRDAGGLSKAAPSATANHQIHGFFKAGVIVDDFDKTLATLKARGVSIAMGPFPASETQRANIIVRDNAGNPIQFFGPTFSRAR